MARTTQRRKGRVRRVILWVVVIALFLCIGPSTAVWTYGPYANAAVRPIREGLTFPWDLVRGAWRAVFSSNDPQEPACQDFQRFLPAETLGPIAHVPIAQHPFMAPNLSLIHI